MGEPKVSCLSIKTIRSPAEAGFTGLVVTEFAILMRYDKCDLTLDFQIEEKKLGKKTPEDKVSPRFQCLLTE